jgi:hypothetical protein
MCIERGLLSKTKTLYLIKVMAYKNKKSVNIFAGIGGIEATIAVMEAIPLCGEIQGVACGALCNLTSLVSKGSDFGATRTMAARRLSSLPSFNTRKTEKFVVVPAKHSSI